MDVQAHKQHAQALEKKGKTAKAITAYRQVLDHLDGSQALLRELPLFVRVGDLCFKQGDKKTALAMYDRAGQLYAEHGSGKSVIAICGKILRVLPKAANTHVHYARMLIEREHIAEARKVLLNYAELFDLPKMQRALDSMEGRSKSEMSTMLEMVLEMADLGMAEAESEDDPATVEIAELDAEIDDEPQFETAVAVEAGPAPVDESTEDEDEEEFQIHKGVTDVLNERPVARQSIITADIASDMDEPDMVEETSQSDADATIVKSGEDWEIEESAVQAEGGEKGPAIAQPEIPTANVPPPDVASDLPVIDFGPPPEGKMDGLVSLGDDRGGDLRADPLSNPQRGDITPRPSASTPVPPGSGAHSRPSSANDPWASAQDRFSSALDRPSMAHGRPSAAYGRPSSAHRSARRRVSKPKKGIHPFQAAMGVALAVALGVVMTKVVPFASLGSGAADAATGGSATPRNATPAGRGSPSGAIQVDTALLAAIPLDSILDSIDVDLGVDSVPGLARPNRDSTLLSVGAGSTGVDSVGVDSTAAGRPQRMPLISVEGLPIEVIRALITPGRTGSRVVQILASGERLTLTVFPLDEAAARDLVDGEVHVANITESIAQGIVRFGNYEVRARATIGSDSLEVLLLRLVEGPPTN